MNKLCTVCHKKEAVWDNFGGICSECFIDKEAKTNRVKHDSELLDKVAEKLKAQFKDMQFHTGRAWFDFDAGIDRCSEKVDKIIAEMKAEVEDE